MAKAKADKKKYLLKNLKIDEVSVVGQGANQPAYVTLLKTENPESVCKQMFADVMQGMAVSEELGKILNSAWKMGDALYDSFHNILMNPLITDKKAKMQESFNQYIAAMSETITNTDVIKEIQRITKTEGDVMSKELEKEVEILKKQNETTAGLLADALALAGMSDVQKVHHAGLSTDEKAIFIKKSAAEMDAEIAKIEESKETYTTSTGNVICKADVGDAAFNVFKAQDEKIKAQDAEIAKQNIEIAKQSEEAVLKSFIAKAETDYPNLPGTPESKGALLKSIDGLPEDQKTTALAMLKSGNETGIAVFKEIGAGGEDVRKATEKLDALAKAKATAENITFAKAYDAVLSTPEGEKLYAESCTK